MPCCAAINCSSKPATKQDKENNALSFHKFPLSKPVFLKRWLSNLRRENYTPQKFSTLCSKHFKEDCFYRFGMRVQLKEDAVPTIFDFPSHLQKIVTPRKPPVERSLPSTSDNGSVKDTSDFDVLKDHSYLSNPQSPKSLKRKHEEQIHVIKKKLKTSQQKSRRLTKKVLSLEQIILDLKSNKLISNSCFDILQSSLSGVPLELMKRLLSKKEFVKVQNTYPEEIRSFAMTLNFYSAKAYEFVRKSFHLALPHPAHIRRWFAKIPADPGFTEPSFKALQAKSIEGKENGKEVICSLMIDEMSIKKHVQWDGQRYRGYVDLGTSANDDDSTPLAKDALVFMAVAVNDKWKVPCGYFLTDGLSGEERANLVLECLGRMHDNGIKIISLTCDGPSCHFSMFQRLGAVPSLPNLTTYFCHPSDPTQNVYILLDICHMLKLIRNTLASGGIIVNQNGEKIRWQYFVDLNDLQNHEGLRLANKLRSSHINWQQQKMKVNLAAQVFSSSVADSLEFCCKILKLPQFLDCMPTVEFIRIFDKLFDIFNSKNAYQKGFKSAMRINNQSYWNPFLDTSFDYISGLQTTTGIPMISTRKKTGFIGFLIAIKSFKGIFEDLIGSMKMDYLLTYKFSQDHIELFFAAVRSAGGSNNNPTAQQFVSAYRRLLVRSVEGGHGNCIKQDQTRVLFVGDSVDLNGKETSVSDIQLIRKYDLEPEESIIDHDYISSTPNVWSTGLSEFKEAAVGYIAGYVVKMVLRKIACLECVAVLTVDSTQCISQLVKFKDRGGLVKPSRDVVQICLTTEKCFDQILLTSQGQLPQGSGILQAVVSTVLRRLNFDQIFTTIHHHVSESATNGVPENHLYRLVKLIIRSYASIKFHHLAKQKNEENSKFKVRKKLSKLILFKHQ